MLVFYQIKYLLLQVSEYIKESINVKTKPILAISTTPQVRLGSTFFLTKGEWSIE